jgi:outer membrane protein assembly factor BamE (lipoprotein component of BamABCDE complex)
VIEMKFRIIAFIAIAAFSTFLSGCVGMNYTQNPLEKGSLLGVGMNKAEVLNIMGVPAKSEISGRYTAWHYCKTGISFANPTDEHMVAFFEGEQLTETQIYTVNLVDTGGATGDCSVFIRTVNWVDAEEIRDHPLVKSAQDILGGEVLKIISDSETK